MPMELEQIEVEIESVFGAIVSVESWRKKLAEAKAEDHPKGDR